MNADASQSRFSLPAIPIALGLGLTILVAFSVGRYPIGLKDVSMAISGKTPENAEAAMRVAVLRNVRLPRIVAALLVGAALAASGAAYQGIFRNPMVSPDILGSTAGAGFGAAIGILLGWGIAGIQVCSFLFGLAAVGLSWLIGTMFSGKRDPALHLVLCGMVVSSLFQAALSFVKYIADPSSKLPAITFWLLGGLSGVDRSDLPLTMIPIVLGAVPLILLRWRINILALGTEEAASLGISASRYRVLVIVSATLMTSAAVSIAGMVGWIGLIVPHASRALVGPNFKRLLPASFLGGAMFLLIVDTIARSVFALELPLGVLTALIGAPFFLLLLAKGKEGWS